MSIVYDFGGLKLELLFSLWGFAPHYVEEVIDPLDDRVKFVIADPHIRHSVYIYDPDEDVIEWEYFVPGETVPNPHIAHMVTDDNPVTGGFWSNVLDKLGAEYGDIICSDRGNRLIIIDRVKNRVRKTIQVPGAKWLHEVLPSKNGDGLIVSDYSAGWFRKMGFDGSIIWSFPLKQASKGSTIYATASSHVESFDGDYLFISNDNPYGVYEVSDNGSLIWSCPPKPPCINATWLYHPHSGFRTGLAEARGNITIVGLEGGGGVIGLDHECRPRFGFMKTHTNMFGEKYIELYRPSYHMFYETTHVFPLLNGDIGVVDWGGKYSSRVYRVLGFPSKTTLIWLLAWDMVVDNKWLYLDPPIETSEWDKTLLSLINIGDSTIEWEIMSTNMPQLYHWDYPSHWYLEYSGRVKPGENDQYIVSDRTAIRVRTRSVEEGRRGKFKIIVQQTRN